MCSSDENGTRFKYLWSEYYDCYSMLKELNDSAQLLKNEILQNKFELMSNYLLATYDIRDPSVLTAIVGHPTIIVEHIAQQFLVFITVRITDKTLNTTKDIDGFSWLCDPFHAESIIEEVAKGFICQHLFVGESMDDARNRAMFLRVLHVLAILLRWPHNQNILLARYGLGFVRIIMDVLQNLCEQVEDSVILWSDTVDGDSLPSTHVLSITTFLLGTLLGVVHIYSSDGVTIPRSQLEPLIQPFTLSFLTKFWCVSIFDLSEVGDILDVCKLSQSSSGDKNINSDINNTINHNNI